MSDSLAEFRRQMSAMTLGAAPVLYGSHDSRAGVESAVRLAQYLAGDEARKALAAFLAKSAGPGELAECYEDDADALLLLLAQIATQPPSAQEDAG